MARTLEISIPPDRTPRLVEEIESVEGLVSYGVQRGGSAFPPGDLVRVTTTSSSLHPFVQRLQDGGLLEGTDWTIRISEPAGLVAPARRHEVATDTNEVLWEEMEFTILRESNMTHNGLAVMATSGVLAAAGVATGTLHLVIAAMVIAPSFEPVVRVALSLVSGTDSWRRGLVDTLKAHLALAAGAAVAAAVLAATGRPLPGGAETYLASEPLLRFWTRLSVPGVMVAMAAGLAGSILVASNRSVLTAGVMVALALVPPPAIAALALVAGEPSMALQAGFRWAAEVGIVVLMGVVVFVWKRWSVQRRPAIG